MVPAIAVPRQEPRLDTLRDRPEISPCCSSAKLDCTMFTDGVSMAPRPSPISRSPGAKTQALGVLMPITSASKTPTPAMVTMKPARIRVRCGYRLARRAAASEDASKPTVAAVKITPVWMAS